MNFLLILIVGFLSTSSTNVSSFDNSSYINDAAIAEVVNDYFVKDMDSPELYKVLEDYTSNEYDQVKHISGHFIAKTETYFYTVYGIKNGEKQYELFKVDEALFSQQAYYDYEEKLNLGTNCRQYLGFPLFCPSGPCTTQTAGSGCARLLCEPKLCNFPVD